MESSLLASVSVVDGWRERTIAGREWLPRESNAGTAGPANALDLDALLVRWAAMRLRTTTNGLN